MNISKKIEGEKPYLFNMHTELDEGSGRNMTFRSILDRSRYIGFSATHDTAHSEPIHGHEHEKVVFILTYLGN